MILKEIYSIICYMPVEVMECCWEVEAECWLAMLGLQAKVEVWSEGVLEVKAKEAMLV